jgi:putative CocE/NonD family hydrolase
VRERRDAVVTVRDEQEWPLARTQWTALHLGDDGTLGPAEPTATGTATFRLRRQAVAFSHRFDRDVELTGPMNLRLRVSLDGADDAHLFVGVEKWGGGHYVPFEGSYGYGRDRIADGRLRLALRDSLDAVCPLQPGEVVDADIELSASSTLFRAGDELRLIIAGRYLEPFNPLFGHLPARYVPSRRGRAIVHCGPGASALTVPVIPDENAVASALGASDTHHDLWR